MAGVTKTEVKKIAITAPLTGYVAGVGTVTPADSILSAIQKLNANIVLNTLTINQKINSASSNFAQTII